MKKILLVLFTTLIYSNCIFSQTIAFQGFESTSNDTWVIANGSSDVSSNTGSSDTPANSRIRTGSYSWQVSNKTATLELNSVDISSYSSVTITIHLSSTSVTSTNGTDAADYIKVYANVDNAGFPSTPDITLNGNNNARWDYSATLTESTNAGTPVTVAAPQGGTNSNNYANLQITVSSASTVALQIVAYNNSTSEYWNIDDIEVSATGLKTEPTNQATSFQVTTPTATTIPLTWTDASSGTLPDGYLIKMKKTGTFTNPVDGTPVVDNSDSVNVAQGTEAYTFTNLTPGTTYYFKIWAYTNSGSSIDYKTDGTVPTANATTGTGSNLLLSALCDPQSNYLTDRYIQIYNAGTSAIDLTGWSVVAVGNGSDIYTWSLSGTIKPGETKTCGDSGNTQFTPDFTGSGTWSSSNSSWNGGTTDGAKLLQSSTLVDDASAFTLGFSDKVAIRNSDITIANETFTASEWTTTSITNANDTPSTPTYHESSQPVISLSTGNWSTLTTNYGSGASYTIDGTVVVDQAVSTPGTCTNITISSGNSLTISSGKALTVSGNLTNNGTLTLASDATGNGSLIVKGTPSGNVTVQRYMAAFSTGSDGWNLISLPVNATISGTSFDPTSSGNNDDLFSWDEVNFTWKNFRKAAFTASRGAGYLMAQQTTTTNSITGTLSNTDVTLGSLSYTTDVGYGWHLLGNPFTSAIKWNDGNWTLTNVGGVAKKWDGTNYLDLNSNDIIPSTNGFFLQVSIGTTGSVTIPAAAQTHDATNNFKASAVQQETLKFKVTNDANTYYDENTFGFKSEATDDYDLAFDSHKLFSFVSAVPQLWTVVNDENYSTNFMTAPGENKTVPLNFKPGVNSTYHLSWTGMDNMDTNLEFLLEDKLTDQTINMRDFSQYDFTAATSDNTDRFVLHINGANGIPQTAADDAALVYALNKSIYIKAKDNQSLNGQVILNNLLGQVVYRGQLNGTAQQVIRTQLNTGVYVVRMELKDGTTMAKKIIIR
ncbi:MAG: lamin tail domain-containing protein [Bacteroidales bacterium]|nr:lamin tail domain-containing protein [Bacteroidales bacterium]